MNNRLKLYPEIRQMLLAILKVFYDPIHLSLMNVLMHHNYMTDKDLAEKLNLDHPTIRSCLTKLLQDKLIQQKMQASTDENEKTIKKDYYYINVKQALNSFMYRLKQTSSKLEAEQNRDICSGKYQCSDATCAELYEDLDMLSIFDPTRNEMICRICMGIVQPIEDKEKRINSREEIKRFNMNINNPFIMLYEECNKHTLGADMVRPDFNIPNKLGAGESGGPAIEQQQQIAVNLRSDASWSQIFKDGSEHIKENPVWARQLIGTGSVIDTVNSGDGKSRAASPPTQMMAPGRVPGALTSSSFLDSGHRDTIELLMANEYNPENELQHHQNIFATSIATPVLRFKAPWIRHPRVTCQRRPVSFSDVSEATLAQMLPDERVRYCQFGQMFVDFSFDTVNYSPPPPQPQQTLQQPLQHQHQLQQQQHIYRGDQNHQQHHQQHPAVHSTSLHHHVQVHSSTKTGTNNSGGNTHSTMTYCS